MDTRKIKKLIELVKETGITELEVTSGDESVRISCKSEVLAQPQTAHIITHPEAAPAATHVTATSEPPATPTPSGYQLKSPMVGTVYLASTPGSKPFVAVGDHVDSGDTLCLIEAMKMFNKIEADKAGVISARLIENESPVEYDQPLFIIDTDE